MALFYPDIILWDDLQMPPILLECIYGKNEFAYLLSRLLLRSPTVGLWASAAAKFVYA